MNGIYPIVRGSDSEKHQKILVIALLVMVMAVLFWVAMTRNTAEVDWSYTYYPATRALIKFQSPYVQAPLFFAPAWSLVPLIPFVLLPEDVGRALFFVTSVLGFAYLGIQSRARPIGIAVLLLSAPVTNCIQTGNIEWIPLLGIFMPAPIGLVFLSMKPQTTIGIITFVLILEARKGFKNVVLASLPTAILFTVSWLVYGPWFLRIGGAIKAAGEFMIHIWPYGIPIGLICMFLAFRRWEVRYAMVASPFLSPYTILITWSGLVMSFASSTIGIVLVSVLSWILWIWFRY